MKNSFTSFAAKMIEAAVDDSPAALLAKVYSFLGRFVAYPSEAAHVAHLLWVFHCHFMDVWESTPRIAFLSPEPGSGKTRALEITELLVPRPIEAVNVSAAYLFRKVGADEGRPTILFDEIDTIFGPKAKNNEDIRGLLNAGHRQGAVAGRCTIRGKIVETEEIPAYCAVALAGLGDLPDTILTRSVVVRMRKRAPSERVEPYRRRVHEKEGSALRESIAAWASTVEGHLNDVWPDMPKGICDRDADVWEPLLAVADAAGGDWPHRARVSAVSLVSLSKESTPSLGIRLLSELRDVFGDHEQMSTKAILEGLINIPESVWGDLNGKSLNDRGLAKRLEAFGVKSKQIRISEWNGKGYTRTDLLDPWNRYLSPSPHRRETSETGETTQPNDTVLASDTGGSKVERIRL